MRILRNRVTLVTAVLLSVGSAAGRAQGTYCRPATDRYAVVFRNQVVQITTWFQDPWPKVRDALQIPRKVESQVVFETKEANCKKAAAAYDAELVRRGEPSRPRRVYVINIDNLIAVSDPDDISPASEWRRSMFFTKKYVYISTFGT